jgi:hypothetical protein
VIALWEVFAGDAMLRLSEFEPVGVASKGGAFYLRKRNPPNFKITENKECMSLSCCENIISVTVFVFFENYLGAINPGNLNYDLKQYF